MQVFPLGTVTAATSLGTYGSLAEPNSGALKSPVYTTLISKSEANTMVTRQKASVYHTFTYTYENLWHREYLEIEKFFNSKKGRANSFYLVDFSNMQKASMSGTTTRIVTYGGKLTSLETSYFTTTAGDGGNYCCVWKPKDSKFRIGQVANITTNASLSFLDASDYGDLSNTSTNCVICPMYRTYFAADQLNPKIGQFNPENDEDGGYMKSLDISFIQYGVN